jgi:hypothetical protein
MTPLYPGDSYQDGTSATTKLGAIGAAEAQRALRLLDDTEVPIREVGAALGRSDRTRLAIVPPPSEGGWYLQQDEAGEPRGISPIRPLAPPNPESVGLVNRHSLGSVAALDSDVSVLSSDYHPKLEVLR